MAKYQEILEAIGNLSKGFGRIDEKANNIWRLTEKQEQHLDRLNGHLDEHSKRIGSNEGELKRIEQKIDERTVPKHKRSKKIITGYSGVVLAVMTLVYYLGQANGWW